MTRAPIATTESADEAAAQSADVLFDAVYARLKAMAGRQLARGSAQASLDTTALVHELYLRVTTNRELAFTHPAQFFAYAARAMRHPCPARDHTVLLPSIPPNPASHMSCPKLWHSDDTRVTLCVGGRNISPPVATILPNVPSTVWTWATGPAGSGRKR